jgi:hypothetical protein
MQICTVWGVGPLAGPIAAEVCRQLAAKGRSVAVLALLDPLTPLALSAPPPTRTGGVRLPVVSEAFTFGVLRSIVERMFGGMLPEDFGSMTMAAQIAALGNLYETALCQAAEDGALCSGGEKSSDSCGSSSSSGSQGSRGGVTQVSFRVLEDGFVI